jgi:hypothetical protein
MKQVPATYPAPPFCFFISSVPHTKIFNLTEHSTCPIYLIFPHSTTLISFKRRVPIMKPPVTSFPVGLNIIFITLFLNTLNPYPAKVENMVSS